MKKLFFMGTLLVGISWASAAVTCTDIAQGLSRRQENASVSSLQNFLFAKGFLKAAPNGYFGVGTFTALKLYQKSVGLPETGSAGPITRAAIKKDSCALGNGSSNTVSTTTSSVAPKPATPVVTIPETPSQARIAKRRDDANKILLALYKRFTDSRGVHPVAITDTPIELCVVPPPIISTATATEVAVLVTPVSPCLTYVDVTNLSPTYLPMVPRDPSLATSSTLTGYTITRSEYNDITILAKATENNTPVKVRCNFNGSCKDIHTISTTTYSLPEITSLDRSIFIRDATPKTPMVISGKNFTDKNTVNIFSSYTVKNYSLGEYAAQTAVASSTKITLNGTSFNQLVSCGNGCLQKLPLGDYSVNVINQGGKSNSLRLIVQGFNTTTTGTQSDTSISPGAKNVKVATLSLSGSLPIVLKSLTLKATTTAASLPSHISNFVMKDTLTNAVYSGPSFVLPNVTLSENQSKIYDMYVDTTDLLNTEAGFITYGGVITINEPISNTDFDVPIKEFSFTVSR